MFSECDIWYTVTSFRDPLLERCPNPAQYSVTIEAYGEVYTVYRCQSCRDGLVTKADSAGIEILDETSLLLYAFVIGSKR
jgi:hypothetical protein